MLPAAMSRCFRVLVLLIISGLFPSLGLAQGSALSGTTLGKSQNSSQDLYNSLTPGKPRFGKNEKNAEVDTKTLQSKKSNDKTFSGSLSDIGLDWNGDKMGKPHGSQDANSTAGGREPLANRSREAGDSVSGEPSAASVPDSETAKQSEATGEKGSKTAKATDATEKKSSDATAEAAEKDQKKLAAAKSDEKSKEKSAKSDGDR